MYRDMTVKWNKPRRRETMFNKILAAIVIMILAAAAVLFIHAIAIGATCIESGNVTLTWVANPESDILGYEVHRSVTGVDGAYEKISGEGLVADTTFVDRILPDGEYTPFYKVCAVDWCGNRSALSGPSEGTIRHDTVAPGVPVAPIESVTP